jgi:hypothetical protein
MKQQKCQEVFLKMSISRQEIMLSRLYRVIYMSQKVLGQTWDKICRRPRVSKGVTPDVSTSHFASLPFVLFQMPRRMFGNAQRLSSEIIRIVDRLAGFKIFDLAGRKCKLVLLN